MLSFWGRAHRTSVPREFLDATIFDGTGRTLADTGIGRRTANAIRCAPFALCAPFTVNPPFAVHLSLIVVTPSYITSSSPLSRQQVNGERRTDGKRRTESERRTANGVRCSASDSGLFLTCAARKCR